MLVILRTASLILIVLIAVDFAIQCLQIAVDGNSLSSQVSLWFSPYNEANILSIWRDKNSTLSPRTCEI